METNAAALAAGVPRQRLEFTYDGQSRRVRRVVKSFNPANQTLEVTKDTRFLYDGWNMIAELEVSPSPSLPLTASPRLAATHAWGLDLSGTETGAGGVGGLVFTALYSTTQTTASNSQAPPGSVLAPCHDGNGNVLAYASAESGTLLGRYEYDPFGRLLLREEDPRIAGRATHLFSTKPLDAETGLSYYGFRYYSAEMGRWVSRDPIGERGGLNRHAFVRNSPTNQYDMYGLLEPSPFSLAMQRYGTMTARKCCGAYGYAMLVGWHAGELLSKVPGFGDVMGEAIYGLCYEDECNAFSAKIDAMIKSSSRPDPDPEFDIANTPDPHMVDLNNPFNKALDECEAQWEDLIKGSNCADVLRKKQEYMEWCLQSKGFDYVL